MPMIGLTPVPREWSKKSHAPNMLPWSVMATAGICCRATSANSAEFLAAPSRVEYSVCTCR